MKHQLPDQRVNRLLMKDCRRVRTLWLKLLKRQRNHRPLLIRRCHRHNLQRQLHPSSNNQLRRLSLWLRPLSQSKWATRHLLFNSLRWLQTKRMPQLQPCQSRALRKLRLFQCKAIILLLLPLRLKLRSLFSQLSKLKQSLHLNNQRLKLFNKVKLKLFHNHKKSRLLHSQRLKLHHNQPKLRQLNNQKLR